MTVSELRTKYVEFFKEKGHVEIPSSSLVPENDPTTLFTGSGMQPLVPYLLGNSHPLGKRLVNSQKSFRAEDIEEIGDNRHTTFFEMLGNWSLGDYFKKEQLSWIFEFWTNKKKGLGIDPSRLYVTVFSGDAKNNIPRDIKSAEIWKQLFAKEDIEASEVELGTIKKGSEIGMQGGRIFYYGTEKNWWSRSGPPEKMPVGEPGGPDSEVFFDFGTPHDQRYGKECHPNCDCGRFVEIGNSVFMEYKKEADGSFSKLAQQNVDFGGGLERTVAVVNNDPDIFKIDVFKNIMDEIKKRYGWDYEIAEGDKKRRMRIIADHIRGAVFMMSDGIFPSNEKRGYIVRRLLRRAIFNGYQLARGFSNLYPLTDQVINSYLTIYKGLDENRGVIHRAFEEEESLFRRTLEKGNKELKKLISQGTVTGHDAFTLFTSHGFPFELTREEAARNGLKVDEKKFSKEMKKHQEISRAGAGQFRGGLADQEPRTIRLHTAHHLLLAALRQVLGSNVKQRGSHITQKRLRMDFSYPEKMTDEQIRAVEKLVNQKVKEGLTVIQKEMPRAGAEKIGAEMEFGAKYPDVVSVYFIEDKEGNAFSKEFCGGPHVQNTREIGQFKILKEEASGAGVRRIRAVVD